MTLGATDAGMWELRPRRVQKESSTGSPFYCFLASGPYAAYGARRKTIEIRNLNKHYSVKHIRPGRPLVLSKGYGKHDRMMGVIGRVVAVRDWWALPRWAVDGSNVRDPERSPFFRAHEPIIAFEVVPS